MTPLLIPVANIVMDQGRVMHQFDSQGPVEGARVVEADGGGHGTEVRRRRRQGSLLIAC